VASPLRLQQGVNDAAAQAIMAVGLNASPCGDRISGAEAMPRNRSLRAKGFSAFTVSDDSSHKVLKKWRTAPGGAPTPWRCQEDHDFAHHSLIRPRLLIRCPAPGRCPHLSWRSCACSITIRTTWLRRTPPRACWVDRPMPGLFPKLEGLSDASRRAGGGARMLRK